MQTNNTNPNPKVILADTQDNHCYIFHYGELISTNDNTVILQNSYCLGSFIHNDRIRKLYDYAKNGIDETERRKVTPQLKYLCFFRHSCIIAECEEAAINNIEMFIEKNSF